MLKWIRFISSPIFLIFGDKGLRSLRAFNWPLSFRRWQFKTYIFLECSDFGAADFWSDSFFGLHMQQTCRTVRRNSSTKRLPPGSAWNWSRRRSQSISDNMEFIFMKSDLWILRDLKAWSSKVGIGDGGLWDFRSVRRFMNTTRWSERSVFWAETMRMSLSLLVRKSSRMFLWSECLQSDVAYYSQWSWEVLHQPVVVRDHGRGYSWSCSSQYWES